MRTIPIAALLGCAVVLGLPARAADPANALDSRRLVLVPVEGELPVERALRSLQAQLERPGAAPRLLERLGWAFVERARLTDDPGDYELAEHAARALESALPDDGGARLLRGHALQSQHRFAEAEAVARRLVAQRAVAADHGLLGDALLEQGRLDEAAVAYQAMMDLRPDSHAYARAAHLLWLAGDEPRALEAMRIAARATSTRNVETFAWMHAQLALHELRVGDSGAAERSCAAALAVHPASATALLVRARIELARGRHAAALAWAARAAERSPLPETLWLEADLLRELGREAESAAVETRLAAVGAGADPRGLALFLASRGRDSATAVALADREIAVRQDVFTLDALAWAQAANGAPEAAWSTMRRAIEPGTRDPRLHLHAAAIARRAGHQEMASESLRIAQERRHLLFPSEQRALDALAAAAITVSDRHSAGRAD